MKKGIFLLIVSLIATMASALDGWVGITKVVSLQNQLELTLVKVENSSNPGNCPSSEYFVFSNNTENGKLINAALLDAAVTGKNVKLAVTGCNNWPVITDVSVL